MEESEMALTELLAQFESEAADVQTANDAKAQAQANLAAAQDAVTAANAALATEKTEARAALDAVIAELNSVAEQLGI